MRSEADKNRGLYCKYKIERTDGSSEQGGKHEGCAYFVLDLVHDQFSGPALLAYADACAAAFPLLAEDLRRSVEGGMPAVRKIMEAASRPIHDAVHQWFELSYSSYMILPRSMLQSMPDEWQEKFIKLVEEMRETLDMTGAPDSYTVTAKNGNKFVKDPFREYERGRRRVPAKR